MVQQLSIFRSLALCVIFCLGFGSSHVHARNEYELSPALDITLSVTAIAASGLGTYLYNQMDVLDPSELRNRENFLPWDRKILGRYSKTAQIMSHVGSALAVAPLAIGGVSWYTGNSNGTEFATFSAMLVQSILFQNGINLATRSLQVWPRPYIYSEYENGSEAGKKEAAEAKGEAYGSFFSGHASASFTVAVFTSEWFDYVYPNSAYTGLVRALAFSLAGVESVLRVAAGKHYPTDILVGALVGTGVSYGVLTLHKKRNEKFSFWVGPYVAGITIRL